MDWLMSVMAGALVPWRLVIGRIGRIGHGELRGKFKGFGLVLIWILMDPFPFQDGVSS